MAVPRLEKGAGHRTPSGARDRVEEEFRATTRALFAARALSSQQEDIVVWSAIHVTDKEIAARLDVTPATVRSYWQRILQKLGKRYREEVLAQVLRHAFLGGNEQEHET